MHVNIKRLLSFLVVLAMVLSMTPVTGIPAIEAKADDTVTESTGTNEGTENVFDPAAATNYCPVCKEDVAWESLPATAAEVGNMYCDGSHYHFYVAEDMSYTSSWLFQIKDNDTDSKNNVATYICLYLNNKTLTLTGGPLYGGYGDVVNVIGDGTMTTTKDNLINSYGCTINLYGGNYVASAGKNVLKIGGGSDVHLYEDAVFQGNTEIPQGKVTLHDSATTGRLAVSGTGKLIVAEGWSGAATVNFAAGLTDGAAPAANYTVKGDFTGSLVCGGYEMVNTNGALTQGEKIVFDDTAATNYCEHCGTYVKWTALKNGEAISTAGHYYVYENMTAADDRLVFGQDFPEGSVCLQLNGKTLTTGKTSNGTIYGSNSIDINIMGDGTIINGGTGPLFEIYTCDLNLYGGTYISNNGKKAMYANSGNAKIYLHNDAKLEGPVDVATGSITLNDSASILALTSSTDKITVTEGWTGYLKNGDGKYLELVDGAWTVVTTPTVDLFDPAAFDGKAYCEACGEAAGPQEWIARSGANRIDYKGDGKHYHYYLSGDLNTPVSTSQVLGLENASTICLNLNGKTMTFGGRMYVGPDCALNIMGDGNAVFTGDTTFVHATNPNISYKDAMITMGATTSTVNIYGGTYSLAGQAVTDAKPVMKAWGTVNIKNATINGEIAVQSAVTNIKLEGSASVENITLTAKTMLTIAAGWSGTANLTVAAGMFDGVALAAANGAAEGDFTGTLTCNGVELSNQNGILMADTEFNPDAATNYCSACKKSVAWTALEGNVNIGLIQTGAEEGSDVHEHYYLKGDVTYDGTDEFLRVNRAGSIQTASSVCLNLNGKTLTTKGSINVTHGCILNIFGEGGTVNYTGTKTWVVGTCYLRLYGGTYTNVPVLTDGSDVKIYLYDGASVNGNINMPAGRLWLYDTSSIGKVTLQTHASYTTRKVILDSDWTGNLVIDATAYMEDYKIPAANAEVTGGVLNGNVTDTNGNVFVYADGQLGINTTFDPDAETNYCRVCNKTVKWEALPETVPTIGTEGAHLHYYVPADMTATGAKNAFLFIEDSNGDAGNVAPKVCLYLNNKTLTLTQYLYAGFSGVVNVIGDGTLTTTSGVLMTPYTSTFNLYGGTYIAKAGGKALTMGGSGANVNLYEDAELQGAANMSQGALTVYDEAVLPNLEISGGKTTFKAGWIGSAAVTVADSLITDGTVNVANAYVEAGATGTLTDVFGAAFTVTGNALVMPENTLDPDVFEPWNHNGYAYCDCVVCGAKMPVQWVDFNDYKAELGDSTLDIKPDTVTLHFYLSEDLNYSGNVLSSYEHIIFNLNGHNITPVAKAGETEITATYAFSCTQKLVLMNTAAEMSTITGWQKKAGDSSVIWINGGGASGTTYLCDNVTLKTHEDCTTDAPVVRIAGNGGKFYMEGGVIDASGKENTDYPTAVYVEGKDTVNAEFYMNGGEIKGGTSVNSAGAVQIGSRFTEASYLGGASFYMTGGTISGGTSNTNGGNILINKNASEAVITGGEITGGTAQNGGNIHSKNANLTIGGTAVISGGTAQGYQWGGGGNIFFGQGTLTVEGGTITGGEVYNVQGNGGNIYLDKKQTANGTESGEGLVETHFLMTDGVISNGYVLDSNDDQNYGGNIRAYNISTVTITGGEIKGGTGCSEQRQYSYNMYISYSDAHLEGDWEAKVTIGGDVEIDGGVFVNNGVKSLVLTGTPVIAGGALGLSYEAEDILPDISGLTEGAQIELSEMTVNVPLTAACDNVDTVKGYITVIDCGATLTTQEGQLILTGVAIVDGDNVSWYANNAEAVAAYDYAAGKYIQLGLDTNLVLTEGEYLIDLAGNVAGEVAIAGKGIVHLFDSANTDYEGFRTATVTGDITLERDNTVIVDGEAIRFLTVTVDGKTSAHALDMAVTDATLNTDKAGLYYGAKYNCDETLAGLVSKYGVILSLKDMPGTVMDGTDKRTELTDFAPGAYATSSSVTGIFKEGRTAEKNAEYGKMKIYANAYIELDLDGNGVADILVADTANVGEQAGNAWSLYDVLLYVDQNWNTYKATEQETIKGFYDSWANLGMSEYSENLPNIDSKAEMDDENVVPEESDVDVPTDQN